jgi:hypothetical protein
MKTFILISITLGNDNYIQGIKDEIVKYLGTREIKDTCVDAPLLETRNLLTNDDKEGISRIIHDSFEEAAAFFIECDYNFGSVGNIATLVPKVYE